MRAISVLAALLLGAYALYFGAIIVTFAVDAWRREWGFDWPLAMTLLMVPAPFAALAAILTGRWRVVAALWCAPPTLFFAALSYQPSRFAAMPPWEMASFLAVLGAPAILSAWLVVALPLLDRRPEAAGAPRAPWRRRR